MVAASMFLPPHHPKARLLALSLWPLDPVGCPVSPLTSMMATFWLSPTHLLLLLLSLPSQLHLLHHPPLRYFLGNAWTLFPYTLLWRAF